MHEQPRYTHEQLCRVVEQTHGLSALDASFQQALARLMGMLFEAGERMNLTAIRDPHQMALALFADSLVLLEADPAVREARQGADIGSGAGFPVLPMALALPGCSWTAIESVGKKCRFMESAAAKLGLKNLRVECGRAEEVARGALRESLDLVTAKAVGAVAALCEVGLPLLKMGGVALLHKTTAALPELEAAQAAIGSLGGRVEEGYSYRLPGDNQERVILRIRKVRATPERFPRPAGVPFKRPLKAEG